MTIVDTLFKICFGPFQKVNNGRTAALIWMVQILGFTGLAIFNAVFFWLGVNISSAGIGILGAVIALGIYLVFDKIYVKNNRAVGNVRFPLLMGLLIFMLLMGSIVLMILSLARY